MKQHTNNILTNKNKDDYLFNATEQKKINNYDDLLKELDSRNSKNIARDKRLETLKNGIDAILNLTQRVEKEKILATEQKKINNYDDLLKELEIENTTDINKSKENENEYTTEEIVSEKRYNFICNYFKKKLNNENNITPEIIYKGTQTVLYHLERGAVTFDKYSNRMIKDVGSNIIPYLTTFYNSVRNNIIGIPEYNKQQFSNNQFLNDHSYYLKNQDYKK